MKGKGKKVAVMDKEPIAESCCFICKDGGDLMICDHKDCLKCYHPFCVGKDDSVLESDDKWICDRHSCFQCRRSSVYLYCYTCKNSVCLRCFPTVNFCQIKGKYGFCEFCLSVVMLIEEKKDYDSDGEKVDFADDQTVEFYFMEYYHTLKKKEELELPDIYAAVERARKGKTPLSDLYLEEDEQTEDEGEEYDGSEDVIQLDGKNTSKRLKSSSKSSKKNNLEGEESEAQKTRNGKRTSKTSGIEGELRWTCRSKRTKLPTRPKKKENKLARKELKEVLSQETDGQRASTSKVIELLNRDDEDVNRGKFGDIECNRWCVRGPYGDRRDECSLSVLRKWSQRVPFSSHFKIWRDDESDENAISLLEAMSFAFPTKSKEDK